MPYLFFVFFLVLFKTLAFAQCPQLEVSATRLPALPVSQPPKMCYATVVADLFSYTYGKNISALTIANLTERSEDGLNQLWRAYRYGQRYAYHRFSPFGKSIQKAFDASNEKTICLKNFLDQIEISEIDKIFYALENVREKNPALLLTEMKKTFDQARLGFAEKLYQLSEKNLPLIDLAINLSCEALPRTQNLTMKSLSAEKVKFNELRMQIEKSLRAGQPVGIGYDFTFLTEPQLADVQKAQHASMIVGQIWNEKLNRCEYRLRLTDLKTCEIVKSTYGCENGFVNLNRDDFVRVISDVHWLETSGHEK